jgi:hypothetical protein
MSGLYAMELPLISKVQQVMEKELFLANEEKEKGYLFSNDEYIPSCDVIVHSSNGADDTVFPWYPELYSTSKTDEMHSFEKGWCEFSYSYALLSSLTGKSTSTSRSGYFILAPDDLFILGFCMRRMQKCIEGAQLNYLKACEYATEINCILKQDFKSYLADELEELTSDEKRKTIEALAMFSDEEIQIHTVLEHKNGDNEIKTIDERYKTLIVHTIRCFVKALRMPPRELHTLNNPSMEASTVSEKSSGKKCNMQ